MKAVPAILTLGIALSACAVALAQDEPSPRPDPAGPASVIGARADEDAGDGAAVLGEPFESLGLGIALRRPAGSKLIRQIGGTQVDFVDEKKMWNLKVARLALEQPMPLKSSKKEDGSRVVGLLEVTVDRLKDQLPGAAVLRNDVVRIGPSDVGMIALRYVKGLETLLSQQAIVRADDNLYFTLTLTSPGSKAAGNDDGDDPAERQAVETFGEVLDTIRLLDQRPLIRDQEERLYATRALLVNLGGKGTLEKKLIPKQWFRLQHKGKDVGYVYAVEEMAEGIPGDAAGALRRKKANRRAGPEGVLVGTRSRTMAGEETRAEAESWMFCTIDRRVEDWSTVQAVENLNDKSKFDHATTVGSSSRRTGRRLDRRAEGLGVRGEKEDPNQPPVRETEDYVLSVTHSSKTERNEPLSQGVSDWYIPQALSHLLPRLLPLDQPRKYMFAVYVPDVRMVMHRYVDVGEEKRVNFAGEAIRAIPVTDRIGLEGSVTTHYMSLDGKYLGSENPDTGIVVLPGDEATLLGIWKDAVLTRPADTKPEQASAAPPQQPGIGGAPAVPAGGAPAVNRRDPSGR